jgi:hypothetical protein
MIMYPFCYYFSLQDLLGEKCILSIASFNAVRGFRTALLRKSRWSSQSSRSTKFGPVDTQFEGVKVETGPVQFSKLWKPLGFTALVSH